MDALLFVPLAMTAGKKSRHARRVEGIAGASVFQVLYKCNYRDWWYDDIAPVGDWNQAVKIAQQVQTTRRCPVQIVNTWTGEVFAC